MALHVTEIYPVQLSRTCIPDGRFGVAVTAPAVVYPGWKCNLYPGLNTMVKAKRKAEIVAALGRRGRARKTRDDGNHEVWDCACGLHRAYVPRHRQISVGVTVKIYKAMVDCPYFGEGWL